MNPNARSWLVAAGMVAGTFALTYSVWLIFGYIGDIERSAGRGRILMPTDAEREMVFSLDDLARYAPSMPVEDSDRLRVNKLVKADGSMMIAYYKRGGRVKGAGRLGTGTVLFHAPDETVARKRLKILRSDMDVGKFEGQRVVPTKALDLREEPELMAWGDEGSCYTVLQRGQPKGTWCAKRRGLRVISFLLHGMYLEYPGEVDELLQTQLARLDAWEP